MQKVVLIDGNSLLHRAYHALPTTLSNHLREPINAVYGFSNMLLKIILGIRPNYSACAFDTQAPTFRHIEFEAYKATRVEAPADLYPQLPKVKEILAAFNIPVFEVDGYEADDIIATITNYITNSSKLLSVIILSTDRDVFQLISDGVKVYTPGRKAGQLVIFDREKVIKKYGVVPEQITDWKALAGDHSDNISGIPGIGPKTAADLLSKFGSVEGIYQNLNQVPEKIRIKLANNKELALQAKALVTLDRNVPLGEFSLDRLRTEIDWDKIKSEFKKFHFKSLASRLERVV